jgi:hypothetical protein
MSRIVHGNECVRCDKSIDDDEALYCSDDTCTKGDIHMPGNASYYKRRHRKWADDVLRKAKYLCEDCKRYGKNTPAVVAHHMEPITERPELAYVLSNGRALCDACHNKRHPEKGGRSF